MEISVGILFPNNLMHALLTSGDTPNEECLVVGGWSAGGFSPRLGFGHQSAPRQSVLWHEFGGCNYTWPLSSPYVHILSLWCTDLCLVSTPRTCDTVVGNALSNLPGCASLRSCTTWITSMSCRYCPMLSLMEDCEKNPFAMSEALGSIHFSEISLCCYTLIWWDTHSDIPFNVNEKLNKEVIRTTSKVLREDCIMVQIWGGLYNFSCCREGSQELSDHVVQVRAQAQPPSCLVCLDEILHCIQQPLALNRCY